MAFVYWIHSENHIDITQEGYIGVSRKLKVRLNEHRRLLRENKHENPVLVRAFHKHKGELTETILLEGPEDYCYEIEEKLRPISHIGWNINKGGFGPPPRTGKTPWNKGRKFIWITDGNRDKTLDIGLTIPDGYKPGRYLVPAACGWNKGLTKETDTRVAANSMACKVPKKTFRK